MTARHGRMTARLRRGASVLSQAVVLTSVIANLPAAAQGMPRQGIDFTVVQPPQPTDAPEGRVEVIEFFGYWCPACNAFEPTMRDWAGRNAATSKVVYVPLPTHFRSGQTNLQKLYYALDAMGLEKDLRPKVFAAIHAQRALSDTADADELANWAAANGIDRKKFIDTFNSFAVLSKVNRANQLASAYGVTSIPSLAIGGKYLLPMDPRTIANADAFLARTRVRP